MSAPERVAAHQRVRVRPFNAMPPARRAAQHAVSWFWRATLSVMALMALIALALVTATPAAVQAQQTVTVWRSSQFSLKLEYAPGWTVIEQRSDPERGDVVILGNETSALLIGLLHDTRTPTEMADDLVLAQKEATPDLAVIQSSVTETGSVLMFMQYTIHPQTDAAMLIDEKALVGQLLPGVSTITVRGMVPDRMDVEAEFEQIERMIGTITPDR